MPSNFKIQIRAELREASGRLIRRYPWRRANSLLKQFVQLLAVQLHQSAQTIKRSSGVSNSISPDALVFRATGAAGDTSNGILIGTGTTAVAIDDYKLETPLITSVAHSAQTLALEAPDASTYRVALSRVFTNNTGASVGIREVALYTLDGAGTPAFALDHTLYSVDVPNGISLTLTYRISISL